MTRIPRRIRPIALYLALVCALIAPNFAPTHRALAAGAATGPATLVKDINTLPARHDWWGSLPSSMVSIGETTYFSAKLDSSGSELWKTDGTAAGTVMVKDIFPGPEDSRPYGFTNLNGTVFFSAISSNDSHQLWKTDGTSAGTRMVKEINPDHSLININGTLFFLSSNVIGDGSRALWKSDGTSDGTTLVKALHTNAATLFNINGSLFFSASDSASGNELWKSDGTANGTVLVKDINPGSTGSEPEQFTNLNGTLFFAAYDSSFRKSLWKSDGTAAGTVQVDPSNMLPQPSELISVNGTLFFSAFRTQEFGGIWGIWKSDGSAAGTSLLKDVEPGFNYSPSSYRFTNINGTLYFIGRDAATGGELWTSDGTVAGTRMVKDINPGASDSLPAGLTVINGVVFFSATQNYDAELWRTDGSANGTTRVKDIAPGLSSSAPGALVNANGVLLFSANDDERGDELWKSDGTANGTTLVKDIDPDADTAFSNNTPELTDVNGTLFFAADAGLGNRGLWTSDGSAAGTTLIKIFPYGQAVDTMPTDLTNVNGTLFFVADGGTTGRELWKSDGSPAGTTLVKDIHPDTGDYARISELVNGNGRLFFSADDGVHGQELWKSDGTSDGTTLVKDINPSQSYSLLKDITFLDGIIYFGIDDGSHGAELWRSNGSAAGTSMVKDINPGAADGFAYGFPQLLSTNGTIFMVASDGIHGSELWRSDGSAAGTTLVKDINPGSADALPNLNWRTPSFATLNGMLFFSADDGTHGRELWKTDGTADGTALIKDIVPGTATSYPDWFSIVNGRLLFSVESPIGNFDLWQSDGTAAGTTLIKASSPTDFKLMRGPIVPLGNTGKAIFRAADNMSGVELWQTDGTVAGTQLLQDIAPGPIPSNPERFIRSGARMFFLADDHAHGRELWSLPIPPGTPSESVQITPDAGGTATFAQVELSFPPNSVTTPITITYSSLDTPTQPLGSAHSAGLSFLLEARNGNGNAVTHFEKPYTLLISYTDEQLAALGINENDLNLAFWNGSAWVNVLPCVGCGVDTANNRLTAVLDHFTEFALVGKAKQVWLPIVRR